MTIRELLALLGLASCCLAVNAAEPATILGTLEEIPAHYAGQSNSRGVRILFHRSGRDWQPFPSSCLDPACLKSITSMFPPIVRWSIGFSGRSLGQVTGRTPTEFAFYADVGLQQITSLGSIPIIGKRAEEYGGFTGSPVLRPLVANSRPYLTDPDAWKPSQPSAEVTAALRAQFRRKFPRVSNCTGQDNTERPWQYRDADIKLVKFYSSKRAWSVVQMQLVGYRCDGPPEENAFVDQWFTIAPQGDIRFLGEGMWLVDAGDYDNDGRSEIVFSISRYNQGGYELFYDEFRKKAEFEFSYH